MSSHVNTTKEAGGSSSEGGNIELAGTEATIPRKQRSTQQWFWSTLDTEMAYVPMLVCCFVSGLTDSTMFNAYRTFVSMQTGNTIFVALGASDQNTTPYGWAYSLCSIACFIIGCFAFSRMSAILGKQRRAALLTSFLLQTIFVVLAAAIIQGGVLNGAYPSQTASGVVVWRELIPVSLLSFQAAGQIVNSRTLGVSEVPTVVITSLLCDLISDPKLTAPLRENAKRNKRIAAFVLTLTGAICGGWITKGTNTVQASLWLIAGIKFLVTVSWMFWTTEAEK
ncbi:DUF1275 domain protein [Coniella lustricola]|uniref:DUF1275 domain protein n=1 Tax=Coniella lustricola TaxID=2025994 RepID=A0A2T3AB53_9PEZI|nr:DUF1275 domain protein [Coniella lustricola]